MLETVSHSGVSVRALCRKAVKIAYVILEVALSDASYVFFSLKRCCFLSSHDCSCFLFMEDQASGTTALSAGGVHNALTHCPVQTTLIRLCFPVRKSGMQFLQHHLMNRADRVTTGSGKCFSADRMINTGHVIIPYTDRRQKHPDAGAG